MKNNLLRMGYVMVSRALLQEICEKKGAACCEEEAFLRVLTNVKFKPAVVFCNGAGVQCARGESVITFMGWADIFGWTRARTRRFFDRCFAAGLIERVPGCCPSHIHVPGYDAWTGQPASIGKVMNGGGSFSAAAAPAACCRLPGRAGRRTHVGAVLLADDRRHLLQLLGHLLQFKPEDERHTIAVCRVCGRTLWRGPARDAAQKKKAARRSRPSTQDAAK